MSYYNLKESGLAIQEIIAESTKRETERANRLTQALNEAAEERTDIKEAFEYKNEQKINFRENVYTEMLCTALNGIFVTALERCAVLSKENILLAESFVKNFVKEQGGARPLLRKISEKTYLLDTIKTIVTEEAEEAIENADDLDKEMEKTPEESKEKLLDRLEKEEDVDNAVDIIAARISNAEEEFIKKNAEDKEKIENIVNDINDRIKAVKSDYSKTDEVKDAIEHECTVMCKRKIGDVYNNRSHCVFEHMVHTIAESVVKDEDLKKLYTTEAGQLDIDHVVGSVRCMYGFLEFVNTIKLDKVDESYIEKVLNEM